MKQAQDPFYINTEEGLKTLDDIVEDENIWTQREVFQFTPEFSYENQHDRDLAMRLWGKQNFKGNYISAQIVSFLEKHDNNKVADWLVNNLWENDYYSQYIERREVRKIFRKKCKDYMIKHEEFNDWVGRKIAAPIAAWTMGLPSERRKYWKKPEMENKYRATTYDYCVDSTVHDLKVARHYAVKGLSFLKDVVVNGAVVGYLAKRYVRIAEKLTNKDHLSTTKENLPVEITYYILEAAAALPLVLSENNIFTEQYWNDLHGIAIVGSALLISHLILRPFLWFKRLYDYKVKHEHTGSLSFAINPNPVSFVIGNLTGAYDVYLKGKEWKQKRNEQTYYKP